MPTVSTLIDLKALTSAAVRPAWLVAKCLSPFAEHTLKGGPKLLTNIWPRATALACRGLTAFATVLFAALPLSGAPQVDEPYPLTLKPVGDALLEYNHETEYIRLKVLQLEIDETRIDEGSRVADFFATLLRGRRTESLVSSVRIAVPDGREFETVLYSLEKVGRNRYKRHSVGATAAIGYEITDPFILRDNQDVKLAIRRYESEEREAVLGTVMQRLGPAGVSGGSEVAAMIFSVLSELFPSMETEIDLSVSVDPSESKEFVIVSEKGDTEFVRLGFEAVEGHFHGERRAGASVHVDLNAALESSGLKEDVEPWMEMIAAADERVAEEGLAPLKLATESFGEFTGSLRLTQSDRARLLGCAVEEWARNAVEGVMLEGETVQFAVGDYLRMPGADLFRVSGTNCAPAGVTCESAACSAVQAFVYMSDRERYRIKYGLRYVDEGFQLLVVDSEGDPVLRRQSK